MINQGAQGGTANVMPTHENKVYGIPTLKTMADYGKSKGIIVSVETRGGAAADAAVAARRTAGAGAGTRPVQPPTSLRRHATSRCTTGCGNAQGLPRHDPPDAAAGGLGAAWRRS